MKRIGAIIAIFLLIGLYVTTLICALIGNEFANSMLMASIFGTIFIPVILYTYLFLFKAFNKGSNMDLDADQDDKNKTDTTSNAPEEQEK